MTIKVTYKVTERVSIRREGACVYLIDGSKEVKLDLADAYEVGSYLRDVCDDNSVAGGWIGMRPNPYRLDEMDYNNDS